MPSDTDVYARQGYGHRLGFGERPALIIVDFTKGFAEPDLLGGGNIVAAIDNTVRLLAAGRAHKLPIVFSRHAYASDGSDLGLFVQKNPNLKKLTTNSETTQIVEKLTPGHGELVLTKRHPSVFFGTDLIGWLVTRRVDTTIIAGCTTSGCIRASVVDALGHGLRPIIVRDCVGDRALGPHEANLFDIEQKFGDVLSLPQVLEQLEVRASRNIDARKVSAA